MTLRAVLRECLILAGMTLLWLIVTAAFGPPRRSEASRADRPQAMPASDYSAVLGQARGWSNTE